MADRHKLYKKVLDRAPFGTLLFAYGVCIDANSRALQILKCQRYRQFIYRTLNRKLIFENFHLLIRRPYSKIRRCYTRKLQRDWVVGERLNTIIVPILEDAFCGVLPDNDILVCAA